jgi:hypothetical protein
MNYKHEEGEPQCVNCNIDLKHHSDTQLRLCYEAHKVLVRLRTLSNVTQRINRELLVKNLTKR